MMKGPRSLGIRDHNKRANHREWIGKAHVIGAYSLCITLHACRLHAHCSSCKGFLPGRGRTFNRTRYSSATKRDQVCIEWSRKAACYVTFALYPSRGHRTSLSSLHYLQALTKEPKIPYQQLACNDQLMGTSSKRVEVEQRKSGCLDI